MNATVNVHDMQRRAKEINNRLWNPPNAKVQKKQPDPVPVLVLVAPAPKPVRPLWSYADVHFDAHVLLWRELTADPHFEARQEVDSFLAETPERKKPVKDIVAEVLQRHPGVTWADVTGNRRVLYMVDARHECIYEVYKQRKDVSTPLIGRLFGKRDHTTILSAIKKMKRREAAQ